MKLSKEKQNQTPKAEKPYPETNKQTKKTRALSKSLLATLPASHIFFCPVHGIIPNIIYISGGVGSSKNILPTEGPLACIGKTFEYIHNGTHELLADKIALLLSTLGYETEIKHTIQELVQAARQGVQCQHDNHYTPEINNAADLILTAASWSIMVYGIIMHLKNKPYFKGLIQRSRKGMKSTFIQ